MINGSKSTTSGENSLVHAKINDADQSAQMRRLVSAMNIRCLGSEMALQITFNVAAVWLVPRGRTVRREACLTTVPGGSLSGDEAKIISPLGTQNKIDTSIFKTNSGFSDVHSNCMQCHMKLKTISKIKISIGIANNLVLQYTSTSDW